MSEAETTVPDVPDWIDEVWKMVDVITDYGVSIEQLDKLARLMHRDIGFTVLLIADKFAENNKGVVSDEFLSGVEGFSRAIDDMLDHWGLDCYGVPVTQAASEVSWRVR